MSWNNWRVATRLNAILLIPVLVALVFGGLRVNSSIETWQEARDAEATAEIVRAAAVYGQAIIDERDRTAQPLLEGRRGAAVVAEARAATDAAAEGFRTAVAAMPQKAGLERRLAAFEKVEPKLAELREAAYTRKLTGVRTEEGYTEVQHPLMEFANELGLGTDNITSYGRTVYALSLAKAAESLQRSIGVHLLVDPAEEDSKELKEQQTSLASYAYLERIALGEYSSGGTPEDVQRLKDDSAALRKTGREKVAEAERQATAAGQEFVAPPAMDEMVALIGSGATSRQLQAKGITPRSWYAASTGRFDMYREIEKDLTDKAVAEAAQVSADAERSTYIDSAIVVAALNVAFLVAGMMARSMSRRMSQLRTAAFGIAEQRLPTLVDQLSRTDPGQVDTRVRPIPISSSDEIGEVARAFDQVHREAVRLAAEQALLRGNVNAIFTNLSRRNQGLIERQLTLITDLENHEADPDQLESLFRMDHLATRMRRNGENLLILAGEEPGHRWNQPVPLVDVLRAATSEVESYERVELTGVPDGEIHGTAVTDLVHLLSELLENAITFSSPHTKVRVGATRLPDGRVMIEIHDKGIGLTPEDFADINHKLADPPSVDAAISQRMGLFVVGRLADRHGIRVQLRPSGEQAGTTSLVMLPEAITHGGGGEEEDEGDFTVSRIVPEHRQAYDPHAGTRTAAELGFDESRFAAAPESPELDPVGRSLMREERRAALEAQATGQNRPLFRDEVQGDADYQGRPPERAGFPERGDPLHRGSLPRREAFPEQGAYSEAGPPPYQAPHQPPHQAPYQPPYDSDGFGAPVGPPEGPYGAYDGARQGEWGEPTAREDHFGSGAEAAPGPQDAHTDPPERVPFERPGPSPSDSHSLTDAGLPMREGNVGRQRWEQPEEPAQPVQPPQPRSAPEAGPDGSQWRTTANDERRRRAERFREPKAGGVTPSGLPRRVPKANLVEGAAEQTPQGGPQVSRDPEDVRGRLSDLRRGVQRGRGAGVDAPQGSQNDQQGYGPGSTYDQER